MIDAGRMTPAGLALVDAARASGAWDDAYRLADDHEVPPALESALRANETAWRNFQHVSNTNQHAFIAEVEAAKTAETRRRRIERAVELAARNRPAYDEDGTSRL